LSNGPVLRARILAARRTPERCLTLRVLRTLAGLVAAVLLAFDDARVARKEACTLERRPKLRLRIDERTADAVANRAGLRGDAAAVDGDANVVSRRPADQLERLRDDHAKRRPRQVLFDLTAVDRNAAGAGPDPHARNRALALACCQSLIGRLCHEFVRP